MKPFIKKHQYNEIKKYLLELIRLLKYSTDTKIIEMNRAIINDKIKGVFLELSDEQEKLLDIMNLVEVLDVENFGANLDTYVYGMTMFTDRQIFNVFKKEKRLKLPIQNEVDKNVYLGWRDEGKKLLYVVYELDEMPLGMICRVQHTEAKIHHICKFCNYTSNEGEVAFVSPVCKTGSGSEYKSIGFSICLDSERCNERITNVDKLSNVIKEVNNI